MKFNFAESKRVRSGRITPSWWWCAGIRCCGPCRTSMRIASGSQELAGVVTSPALWRESIRGVLGGRAGLRLRLSRGEQCLDGESRRRLRLRRASGGCDCLIPVRTSAACGIRFVVNGMMDIAYPMDSYRKTYLLVPEQLRHVLMAVSVRTNHLRTFPEVDAFVDSALRGDPTLPRIGAVRVKKGLLTAPVDRAKGFNESSRATRRILVRGSSGKWQTVPARNDDGN